MNDSKSAKERLIAFIMGLSEEQAERYTEHFRVLYMLKEMSVNEWIFIETFIDKLFGFGSVNLYEP